MDADYILLKAVNPNRPFCMQGLVQLFKFMSHCLHFALNNGFSSLMKWFWWRNYIVAENTSCVYLPLPPQGEGQKMSSSNIYVAKIPWEVIKLELTALAPRCHLENKRALAAPCQMTQLERTNRLCFSDFKRYQ